MTYDNAVKEFKDAVDQFSDRRGDYIVNLEITAGEVTNYLVLRGNAAEAVAVEAAVSHAVDSVGDYLYELDTAVETVEGFTNANRRNAAGWQ